MNFVSLHTTKTGHEGVISTRAALTMKPVLEVVMTECNLQRKICSTCKVEKSVSEFYTRKAGYIENPCRACKQLIDRRRNARKTEARLARCRANSIPEPAPIEGARFIPLHNYRGEVIAYCIVDESDLAWLSQWRWSWNRHTGQVYRAEHYTPKQVNVCIYRQIMNAPAGMEVDHINGNRLDNRRANLRVCTRQHNQMNCPAKSNAVSKYIGVHRHTKVQKWVARVTHMGKNLHVGLFATEEEAARARDKRAFELRGEYARLNFPDEYR